MFKKVQQFQSHGWKPPLPLWLENFSPICYANANIVRYESNGKKNLNLIQKLTETCKKNVKKKKSTKFGIEMVNEQEMEICSNIVINNLVKSIRVICEEAIEI